MTGNAVQPNADVAVRISNLSFSYRGAAELALDDLTLDIKPGEFVVIMGPSGAERARCARPSMASFRI
jgi:ABC-type bacteriocin/lantibiotic exporter with double-glycine peptidase domain